MSRDLHDRLVLFVIMFQVGCLLLYVIADLVKARLAEDKEKAGINEYEISGKRHA